MKNVELKGIIPPILTPMNPDESINLKELRNQIERLLKGGVHGVFPFGTNGEGYILSENEKIEVLEATIDQVKGRVPVYAGTGRAHALADLRLYVLNGGKKLLHGHAVFLFAGDRPCRS